MTIYPYFLLSIPRIATAQGLAATSSRAMGLAAVVLVQFRSASSSCCSVAISVAIWRWQFSRAASALPMSY